MLAISDWGGAQVALQAQQSTNRNKPTAHLLRVALDFIGAKAQGGPGPSDVPPTLPDTLDDPNPLPATGRHDSLGELPGVRQDPMAVGQPRSIHRALPRVGIAVALTVDVTPLQTREAREEVGGITPRCDKSQERTERATSS